MSDLISRQAAIDAITDEHIVTNMDSVYDSVLHRCKRATHRILANLPTIDPVKHGEWVRNNPLTDTLSCSVCNYEIPTEELRTPYCPWCGARMERRKDGNDN